MIALDLKNRSLVALAFGALLVMLELVFGARSFLQATSSWVVLVSVFSVSTVVEFILLTVFARVLSDERRIRFGFAFSFSIAALLSSSVVWILFNADNSMYFVFVSAFLVISLLPTLLSFLYFLFKEAESKIQPSVEVTYAEGPGTEKEIRTFTLESDHGKPILRVDADHLICFEANDNYVVTYYLDKEGTLKKSMDRCSLRKIDEILSNSGIHFERVHKSYIVNPAFVESVKGKAQAYKLKLRLLEEPVPVSRSYDVTLLEG